MNSLLIPENGVQHEPARDDIRIHDVENPHAQIGLVEMREAVLDHELRIPRMKRRSMVKLIKTEAVDADDVLKEALVDIGGASSADRRFAMNRIKSMLAPKL